MIWAALIFAGIFVLCLYAWGLYLLTSHHQAAWRVLAEIEKLVQRSSWQQAMLMAVDKSPDPLFLGLTRALAPEYRGQVEGALPPLRQPLLRTAFWAVLWLLPLGLTIIALPGHTAVSSVEEHASIAQFRLPVYAMSAALGGVMTLSIWMQRSLPEMTRERVINLMSVIAAKK